MNDRQKVLRLHDIDECRRNVLAYGWDRRRTMPGVTAPELEAYREGVASAQQRLSTLEAALHKIAVPQRPDGTYNLSREACEQIAREALDGQPSSVASLGPEGKALRGEAGSSDQRSTSGPEACERVLTARERHPKTYFQGRNK